MGPGAYVYKFPQGYTHGWNCWVIAMHTFNYWILPNAFPKWFYEFALPPATPRSSHCSVYTLTLGTVGGFLKTAFLRYNSHTAEFVLSKHTIWWFSVCPQSYASIITINFRTLLYTYIKSSQCTLQMCYRFIASDTYCGLFLHFLHGGVLWTWRTKVLNFVVRFIYTFFSCLCFWCRG